MPCGPVRVNSACFSMNANASFTSAWWARSITTATAGSATAHRVETDFTGENVKSKPATVCVRGRESSRFAPPVPEHRSARGHAPQGRTCGPPRSAPGPGLWRQGNAGGHAGRRLDRSDTFGDLEPERADDTIDDLERRPKPGRVLKVALAEIRPFQLLLAELGQQMQTCFAPPVGIEPTTDRLETDHDQQ
jgi:hypothetical protein